MRMVCISKEHDIAVGLRLAVAEVRLAAAVAAEDK